MLVKPTCSTIKVSVIADKGTDGLLFVSGLAIGVATLVESIRGDTQGPKGERVEQGPSIAVGAVVAWPTEAKFSEAAKYKGVTLLGSLTCKKARM